MNGLMLLEGKQTVGMKPDMEFILVQQLLCGVVVGQNMLSLFNWKMKN